MYCFYFLEVAAFGLTVRFLLDLCFSFSPLVSRVNSARLAPSPMPARKRSGRSSRLFMRHITFLPPLGGLKTAAGAGKGTSLLLHLPPLLLRLLLFPLLPTSSPFTFSFAFYFCRYLAFYAYGFAVCVAAFLAAAGGVRRRPGVPDDLPSAQREPR